MADTKTIHDIMRILPHRFPFLLIDRVLEISDDHTACKVLKNVTANEPQFTGHFPEYPVMPGVLIIEAMAQACAVLGIARLTEEQRQEKALFFFAGIDEARFKRVVQPGDQLIFECICFFCNLERVGIPTPIAVEKNAVWQILFQLLAYRCFADSHCSAE